jgi:hypothetical protein
MRMSSVGAVVLPCVLFYLFPFRFSRSAHRLATGRKKSEGLTLDRAVRLLRSALVRPEMTVEVAIALVDYHARWNKVAKASHDKA